MAAMDAAARPHVFIRSRALGRDWRGRAYCRCNLPETSSRHRPDPKLPLDWAARAAGERPDDDDGGAGLPVP
jgi:hypothetical protein